MAQDEASFDFPTFRVSVRYLGDQEGPAYATLIEVPNFDQISGGIILNKLPLFSSAARAAISQMRGLLNVGVKAFLEAYRKNTGSISFKELQNMRLLFLSWHDAMTAVGDEALVAAEVQLKEQEKAESIATYGKEQETDEPITPDATFDLGPVQMDVHMMGLVDNNPLWHVTATPTGTDLHASSLIGVESPFPIHGAQHMVDNLIAVFEQGVDLYLKQDPRATRTPVTDDKRLYTGVLYNVAAQIGAEGLAEAAENVKNMIKEWVESIEDQAVADMEMRISEYRQRRAKA